MEFKHVDLDSPDQKSILGAGDNSFQRLVVNIVMRIIKKIYTRDSLSLLISREFDSMITHADLPFLDALEVSIGYGRTEMKEFSAKIAFETEDPIMQQMDKRAVNALVRLELSRLLVKRVYDCHHPVIEDLLAARMMIKNGFSEDLAYLFYIFMVNHKTTDVLSYIRCNLPWLAFSDDGFYRDFFQRWAGAHSRPAYKKMTEWLLGLLEKDIDNDHTLKACEKAYEDVLHAGTKV